MPDENTLRLAAMQDFLRRGLSLAEAVKAVNEHFRKKDSEQAAPSAGGGTGDGAAEGETGHG